MSSSAHSEAGGSCSAGTDIRSVCPSTVSSSDVRGATSEAGSSVATPSVSTDLQAKCRTTLGMAARCNVRPSWSTDSVKVPPPGPVDTSSSVGGSSLVSLPDAWSGIGADSVDDPDVHELQCWARPHVTSGPSPWWRRSMGSFPIVRDSSRRDGAPRRGESRIGEAEGCCAVVVVTSPLDVRKCRRCSNPCCADRRRGSVQRLRHQADASVSRVRFRSPRPRGRHGSKTGG